MKGGALRLDTQQRRALLPAQWQHAPQGNAVDLHGLQLQPGLLDDAFKWRQCTLPARSYHHLSAAWLDARASQNLKIQGQVFQRKWKQPFGVSQQLRLHFWPTLFHRQMAHFADHLVARQCQRDPALPEAAASVGPPQGSRHGARFCHPITASR